MVAKKPEPKETPAVNDKVAADSAAAKEPEESKSTAKPAAKAASSADSTEKKATPKRAAAKTESAKAADKVATAKAAVKTAGKAAAEKAQAAKEVAEKAATKTATKIATKAATAKASTAKATAAKASSAKATEKKTTAAKATTATTTKAAASEKPVAKAEGKKPADKVETTAKPADQATTKKPTAKKPAAKKPAAKKASRAKTATKTETKKVAADEKQAEQVVAAEETAKTVEKPAEATPEVKLEAVAEKTADVQVAAAPVEEAVEPEPAEPAESAEPAAKDETAPAEEPVSVPVEEPAPEPEPEFASVGGVLIAAAECAPLVKIGGLADVVGALPKYLKEIGVDARVIMPFHRQIKERYAGEVQHLCDFQASLGWRSQYVGVEKLEIDGTVYYFIDNEFYFGGPVYCGGEFEGEQYAFFTRAVMDCIPQLDFDVRILHCNDWHTAMMPLLAKTQYQGGMQAGLRTILTIHNLHFQGQFSHEFDRDLLRIDDSLATPQFIEHYGCDNMLKAGIVFADKVTTVSPTYSQEICGPELGESLEGVLRSRGGDLWGILNGIDIDVWNPQTDEALVARYSEKSAWRKVKNRDALLEELGLAPAGENTAVISMVGRLTPQKGVDLVRMVLDEVMTEDVRMIMLGSGDEEYEQFFREAEWRHKGRLCSYIGYNGELSHRIYAGSDLFLMPSLFEPCGISQMIAMRYGTLPIVRETGGLKDTVMPYNEFTGEGNGFSFANYDAGEMLGVIRLALGVWRNEDVRKQLIKQAMESDFGFARCAYTYALLYRELSW